MSNIFRVEKRKRKLTNSAFIFKTLMLVHHFQRQTSQTNNNLLAEPNCAQFIIPYNYYYYTYIHDGTVRWSQTEVAVIKGQMKVIFKD